MPRPNGATLSVLYNTALRISVTEYHSEIQKVSLLLIKCNKDYRELLILSVYHLIH